MHSVGLDTLQGIVFRLQVPTPVAHQSLHPRQLQEVDATLQVWGYREGLGLSLGLGAGDEPAQSLGVRVRGQTSTADIAVGVYYLSKKAKETFVRELDKALVLMYDFNHLSICQKGNAAGCKQSRSYFECIKDNFWM